MADALTLAEVVPKIGKCVRLLASSQKGEVLAALAALNRTLNSADLDFNDLAAAVELGLRPRAKPEEPEPAKPSLSNLDMALWVRDNHAADLTAKERDFIASCIRILAFGSHFSENQQNWLRSIYLSNGGTL